MEELPAKAPRSDETDLFGVALPEGRALLGWGTLVIAIYVALTIGTAGITERSISATVRWTGRISMLIFLGAYLRPAVFADSPASLGGWATRNHRWLLTLLGSSHTIHAAAIGTLAYLYAPGFGTTAYVIGGLGYAGVFFLASMAVAGKIAASPGESGLLERVTTHYVWFVFTATAATSVSRKPEAALFALLAVVAAYYRYSATKNRAA